MSIQKSGVFLSAKKISLEILALKHVQLDALWNYQNVTSPFTRIYFATDGEGEIVCKNKKYLVKKGQIIIIPAMTKYSCKCENSLNKFYAHVSLIGPNRLDLLSNVNNVIVMPDNENFTTQLFTLSKDNLYENALEIKILLFNVLLKALKHNNVMLGQAKNYSPLIENALDYIDKNLNANLKIEQIARSLSISKITLQKKWSKELTIPIGKYIDEKLMLLCERELRKGDLNIGEISDKFGFCDRFYFSRKFKQKLGVSPKKYMMINNI